MKYISKSTITTLKAIKNTKQQNSIFYSVDLNYYKYYDEYYKEDRGQACPGSSGGTDESRRQYVQLNSIIVLDTTTHLLLREMCFYMVGHNNASPFTGKYNPVVPEVQGLGNEIIHRAP